MDIADIFSSHVPGQKPEIENISQLEQWIYNIDTDKPRNYGDEVN